MIGLPSARLVLLTFQAPPGAPLRSGSIVILSWSPALSDLLVHPSRTRALGLPPSRFQTASAPSGPFALSRMKVCGLVNLNSVTVPASSIGCSWSNIANEWCAKTAPLMASAPPASSAASVCRPMRNLPLLGRWSLLGLWPHGPIVQHYVTTYHTVTHNSNTANRAPENFPAGRVAPLGYRPRGALRIRGARPTSIP